MQRDNRGGKKFMTLKEKTINAIIDREAGYVDNKDDSGGPTRFGITEKKAREYDYTGRMQDLQREFAYMIYEDEYWNGIMADELVKLSIPVAEEMADTAVNLGPAQAVSFLQRSLTALNTRNNELLYPDVKNDHVMGRKTIAALKAYLGQRTEPILVRSLNGLQLNFYMELTERRKKDRNFFYGWVRTRVVM